VLLDLRREGTTLVLSSHQMETVERLCDRVALIHKGRKILDGSVAEVKRDHGRNALALAYEGDASFLPRLPGVTVISDSGRYAELRLEDGADPQAVLREAAARLRVSRFLTLEPSLHDIFVARVGEDPEKAVSGEGGPRTPGLGGG
jgi:ABC-2 type transport system ATP-binding protein